MANVWNVVSDEEDEEFLDDDPGLDIVYKENLEVSLERVQRRLIYDVE